MKTVFFDIDTQIDFMFPSGALYVPGAEHIIPIVAALNRKAPFVISTMCAHREDDPEFDLYAHHCVVGTVGQQKPAATLLNDAARQMFLPKQQLSMFSVPELPAILERLKREWTVENVIPDCSCSALSRCHRSRYSETCAPRLREEHRSASTPTRGALLPSYFRSVSHGT